MFWHVSFFSICLFIGVAGAGFPIISGILLIPYWLEWTDSKTYQWGAIIGAAVICIVLQTIATYQFYLDQKKKNENF